jgi:hypothetical protein
MAKRLLWTEDKNAELRSLAGTKSPAEVAAELGRSVGAVMVQASKLKVSMAHKRPRTLAVSRAADVQSVARGAVRVRKKQKRAPFYNPHSTPGY